MIVCLDTNTVVQALAEGHPYHPIVVYKPQPITPGEFISKFVTGASPGSAK